jgi:hypothetical protein
VPGTRLADIEPRTPRGHRSCDMRGIWVVAVAEHLGRAAGVNPPAKQLHLLGRPRAIAGH